MGIWQDLWRGRSADFDSGSAATNSIELTKRNHTVSLTKQGAATGNLRINLSWRMRTSDIGGPQRGSLLRHPSAPSNRKWSGRTPRAWSTWTSTWASCTS